MHSEGRKQHPGSRQYIASPAFALSSFTNLDDAKSETGAGEGTNSAVFDVSRNVMPSVLLCCTYDELITVSPSSLLQDSHV